VKTVLIDGNNIMQRSLHSDGTMIIDPNNKYNVLDYDWNMFRFNIFNYIYWSIKQAKNCSELVFAIDGKRHETWRNYVWKKYKANRDKPKPSDKNIDWKLVTEKYLNFAQELSENFPFKIIQYKLAEGDDIISTIVMNSPQKHYIVSVDKDYIQLYEPNRVEIYSPLKQSTIKHPNPEHFLIEQCLLGQSKDNIYNIKTPLDHPEDKRKIGFGPKALEKVMTIGYKKWLKDNNLEEKFDFNRSLIDFKKIPKELQNIIMKKYNKSNKPDPNKMYKFIKKQNWTMFLDNWTNIEYTLMELY